MALTLAESAKYTTNQLQRGVIETFIQYAKVLDKLFLVEIEGNAYQYNEEQTLPGVEFRGVNAAYTESTGVVNPKTEGLVILGGDADVDTFITKTRSNKNDVRAEQTKMKVKAANYKFQDAFINGDTAVDANSFDGLKKRLVGGQVLTAAANGIPVLGTTDSERQTFFDVLDALLAQCPGANALYMNDAILAKVLSSMRRLTMNTTPIERFGKQFPAYNGVPLLTIGQKSDGSEIITNAEVQGSATDCSSIYAVKFGEDEADGGVCGLTNGGIDVRDLGETEVKPAYRTRIEFFCGMGLFGGKAAARVRGIRNA
jgi:hypothetical protein